MVRQAIETPSVVQQVAKVLQSYAEGGQIIREALQNASDAESTNFEVYLDLQTYSHGASSSSSSSNSSSAGNGKAKAEAMPKKKARNTGAQQADAGLLSSELVAYQGPALVFKNGAKFSETDMAMFSRVSQSDKTDRPDKIGRFGLGRLSYFHIGDIIQVVSGKTMLFVEPHEKIFGADPKADERHDFLEKKGEFVRKFPGHCDPFRKFGVDFQSEFAGAVIRVPLRTEEQANTTQLLKTATAKTPEALRKLLQKFAADCPRLFFFLPHVRRITVGVYSAPADGNISSSTLEKLAHVLAKREEASGSAEAASCQSGAVCYGENGNVVASGSEDEEGAIMKYLSKSKDFDTLQQEGKKDRRVEGKLPVESYTLTLHGAYLSAERNKMAPLPLSRIAVQQRLSGKEELWKRVRTIQAAPLVGVAVSLTDLDKQSSRAPNSAAVSAGGAASSTTSAKNISPSSAQHDAIAAGQAYTVLPLSISLGLPVSINGIFSLSDNRRELWTSVDLDDADDRDIWNCELQTAAGEIYADVVLKSLQLQGKNGDSGKSGVFPSDASSYFRLWPPTAKIDSKWQPVVDAFLESIKSKAVLPLLGSLQEFRTPKGSCMIKTGTERDAFDEAALGDLRTFIATTPRAQELAKDLALVDVPESAQKLLHDTACVWSSKDIFCHIFLPALAADARGAGYAVDKLLLYFLEKVVSGMSLDDWRCDESVQSLLVSPIFPSADGTRDLLSNLFDATDDNSRLLLPSQIIAPCLTKASEAVLTFLRKHLKDELAYDDLITVARRVAGMAVGNRAAARELASNIRDHLTILLERTRNAPSDAQKDKLFGHQIAWIPQCTREEFFEKDGGDTLGLKWPSAEGADNGFCCGAVLRERSEVGAAVFSVVPLTLWHKADMKSAFLSASELCREPTADQLQRQLGALLDCVPGEKATPAQVGEWEKHLFRAFHVVEPALRAEKEALSDWKQEQREAKQAVSGFRDASRSMQQAFRSAPLSRPEAPMTEAMQKLKEQTAVQQKQASFLRSSSATTCRLDVRKFVLTGQAYPPLLFPPHDDFMNYREILALLGVPRAADLALLTRVMKEAYAARGSEPTIASGVLEAMFRDLVGNLQKAHDATYNGPVLSHDGKLRMPERVVFNDLHWIQSPKLPNGKEALLHKFSTQEVASRMGVAMLRDVSQQADNLWKEQDDVLGAARNTTTPSASAPATTSSSENAATAFGQQVSAIDTIKGVLSDYSDGGSGIDSVIREFAQNPDDCGATEFVTILDEREHPREKVLRKSMEPLQGAAIVFAMDSVVTPTDLIAMQNIGRSSKKHSFVKDGRHGKGMNTMYHLTDQPILRTPEKVCFFDPQEQYAGQSQSRPGYCDTVARLQTNYGDLLEPFEFPEALKIPRQTQFRLPLRTEKMARSCILKDRCEAVTADGILEELREWVESNGDRYLLFPKTIRTFRIVRISSAGDYETIFDRSRTFSPLSLHPSLAQSAGAAAAETRSSGFIRTIITGQMVEQQQDGNENFMSGLPATVTEVEQELQKKTTETKDRVRVGVVQVENKVAKASSFYIVCLYYNASLLDKSLHHFHSAHFALLPVGGVALPVHEEDEDSTRKSDASSNPAFCFWPLRDAPTPLRNCHVHAMWHLDSTRKGLAFEPVSGSDWNAQVRDKVLVPAWTMAFACGLEELKKTKVRKMVLGDGITAGGRPQLALEGASSSSRRSAALSKEETSAAEKRDQVVDDGKRIARYIDFPSGTGASGAWAGFGRLCVSNLLKMKLPFVPTTLGWVACDRGLHDLREEAAFADPGTPEARKLRNLAGRFVPLAAMPAAAKTALVTTIRACHSGAANGGAGATTASIISPDIALRREVLCERISEKWIADRKGGPTSSDIVPIEEVPDWLRDATIPASTTVVDLLDIIFSLPEQQRRSSSEENAQPASEEQQGVYNYLKGVPLLLLGPPQSLRITTFPGGATQGSKSKYFAVNFSHNPLPLAPEKCISSDMRKALEKASGLWSSLTKKLDAKALVASPLEDVFEPKVLEKLTKHGYLHSSEMQNRKSWLKNAFYHHLKQAEDGLSSSADFNKHLAKWPAIETSCGKWMPVSSAGQITDITQHKQYETKLRDILRTTRLKIRSEDESLPPVLNNKLEKLTLKLLCDAIKSQQVIAKVFASSAASTTSASKDGTAAAPTLSPPPGVVAIADISKGAAEAAHTFGNREWVIETLRCVLAVGGNTASANELEGLPLLLTAGDFLTTISVSRATSRPLYNAEYADLWPRAPWFFIAKDLLLEDAAVPKGLLSKFDMKALTGAGDEVGKSTLAHIFVPAVAERLAKGHGFVEDKVHVDIVTAWLPAFSRFLIDQKHDLEKAADSGDVSDAADHKVAYLNTHLFSPLKSTNLPIVPTTTNKIFSLAVASERVVGRIGSGAGTSMALQEQFESKILRGSGYETAHFPADGKARAVLESSLVSLNRELVKKVLREYVGRGGGSQGVPANDSLLGAKILKGEAVPISQLPPQVKDLFGDANWLQRMIEFFVSCRSPSPFSAGDTHAPASGVSLDVLSNLPLLHLYSEKLCCFRATATEGTPEKKVFHPGSAVLWPRRPDDFAAELTCRQVKDLLPQLRLEHFSITSNVNVLDAVFDSSKKSALQKNKYLSKNDVPAQWLQKFVNLLSARAQQHQQQQQQQQQQQHTTEIKGLLQGPLSVWPVVTTTCGKIVSQPLFGSVIKYLSGVDDSDARKLRKMLQEKMRLLVFEPQQDSECPEVVRNMLCDTAEKFGSLLRTTAHCVEYIRDKASAEERKLLVDALSRDEKGKFQLLALPFFSLANKADVGGSSARVALHVKEYSSSDSSPEKPFAQARADWRVLSEVASQNKEFLKLIGASSRMVQSTKRLLLWPAGDPKLSDLYRQSLQLPTFSELEAIKAFVVPELPSMDLVHQKQWLQHIFATIQPLLGAKAEQEKDGSDDAPAVSPEIDAMKKLVNALRISKFVIPPTPAAESDSAGSRKAVCEFVDPRVDVLHTFCKDKALPQQYFAGVMGVHPQKQQQQLQWQNFLCFDLGLRREMNAHEFKHAAKTIHDKNAEEQVGAMPAYPNALSADLESRAKLLFHYLVRIVREERYEEVLGQNLLAQIKDLKFCPAQRRDLYEVGPDDEDDLHPERLKLLIEKRLLVSPSAATYNPGSKADRSVNASGMVEWDACHLVLDCVISPEQKPISHKVATKIGLLRPSPQHVKQHLEKLRDWLSAMNVDEGDYPMSHSVNKLDSCYWIYGDTINGERMARTFESAVGSCFEYMENRLHDKSGATDWEAEFERCGLKDFITSQPIFPASRAQGETKLNRAACDGEEDDEDSEDDAAAADEDPFGEGDFAAASSTNKRKQPATRDQSGKITAATGTNKGPAKKARKIADKSGKSGKMKSAKNAKNPDGGGDGGDDDAAPGKPAATHYCKMEHCFSQDLRGELGYNVPDLVLDKYFFEHRESFLRFAHLKEFFKNELKSTPQVEDYIQLLDWMADEQVAEPAAADAHEEGDNGMPPGGDSRKAVAFLSNTAKAAGFQSSSLNTASSSSAARAAVAVSAASSSSSSSSKPKNNDGDEPADEGDVEVPAPAPAAQQSYNPLDRKQMQAVVWAVEKFVDLKEMKKENPKAKMMLVDTEMRFALSSQLLWRGHAKEKSQRKEHGFRGFRILHSQIERKLQKAKSRLRNWLGALGVRDVEMVMEERVAESSKVGGMVVRGGDREDEKFQRGFGLAGEGEADGKRKDFEMGKNNDRIDPFVHVLATHLQSPAFGAVLQHILSTDDDEHGGQKPNPFALCEHLSSLRVVLCANLKTVLYNVDKKCQAEGSEQSAIAHFERRRNGPHGGEGASSSILAACGGTTSDADGVPTLYLCRRLFGFAAGPTAAIHKLFAEAGKALPGLSTRPASTSNALTKSAAAVSKHLLTPVWEKIKPADRQLQKNTFAKVVLSVVTGFVSAGDKMNQNKTLGVSTSGAKPAVVQQLFNVASAEEMAQATDAAEALKNEISLANITVTVGGLLPMYAVGLVDLRSVGTRALLLNDFRSSRSTCKERLGIKPPTSLLKVGEIIVVRRGMMSPRLQVGCVTGIGDEGASVDFSFSTVNNGDETNGCDISYGFFHIYKFLTERLTRNFVDGKGQVTIWQGERVHIASQKLSADAACVYDIVMDLSVPSEENKRDDNITGTNMNKNSASPPPMKKQKTAAVAGQSKAAASSSAVQRDLPSEEPARRGISNADYSARLEAIATALPEAARFRFLVDEQLCWYNQFHLWNLAQSKEVRDYLEKEFEREAEQSLTRESAAISRGGKAAVASSNSSGAAAAANKKDKQRIVEVEKKVWQLISARSRAIRALGTKLKTKLLDDSALLSELLPRVLSQMYFAQLDSIVAVQNFEGGAIMMHDEDHEDHSAEANGIEDDSLFDEGLAPLDALGGANTDQDERANLLEPQQDGSALTSSLQEELADATRRSAASFQRGEELLLNHAARKSAEDKLMEAAFHFARAAHLKFPDVAGGGLAAFLQDRGAESDIVDAARVVDARDVKAGKSDADSVCKFRNAVEKILQGSD